MVIGYPEGIKGYKLWFSNNTGSKSFFSREVTFRESEMFMSSPIHEAISDQNDQISHLEVELPIQKTNDINQQLDITKEDSKELVDHEPTQQDELQNYKLSKDKVKTQVKLLEKYGFVDILSQKIAIGYLQCLAPQLIEIGTYMQNKVYGARFYQYVVLDITSALQYF